MFYVVFLDCNNKNTTT